MRFLITKSSKCGGMGQSAKPDQIELMHFNVKNSRKYAKSTIFLLALSCVIIFVSVFRNYTLMKTNMIVLAFLVIAFWGCDNKEKIALQAKVDSLYVEVQEQDELLLTLQNVGSLLDSIDINRQVLHTNMVEGTSYRQYTERLSSINDYIRQTTDKIESLEKKIKNQNSGYALTIKKLKADLEASSLQVAALQEEADKMRQENQLLSANLNQKDSVVAQQSTMLKLRDENIATLDSKIVSISTEAKQKEADLLFAQAEAMELAASRTKLAPRKKKDTKREALELYKMSYALGKSEAQERIASLEGAI